MKPSLFSSAFASLFFFASVPGFAEPTSVTAKDSKLAPIAFLTANDWVATLPQRPDGKTVVIHAHFTWAENRQAIRVSNQFVIDGKPKPYIDGVYFWNPGSQKIEFVWSDAEGNLSRGGVTQSEGKLIHDFEIAQPDGKSDAYVARVTQQPDGSWTNEILTKRDGALEPFVQVTYRPEKK